MAQDLRLGLRLIQCNALLFERDSGLGQRKPWAQ
jgi:hypothetical protein